MLRLHRKVRCAIDKTTRDLISSLAAEVSSNISDWYGQNAVLQAGSADLLVYPGSFFVSFPVNTDAGLHTLLAKIHRKPDIPSLADAISMDWLRPVARSEYKMTRMIWRTFKDENSPFFSTVEPLAYMEDWNAILMRKVEGRSLKRFLLRPSIVLRDPRVLRELQDYLTAAVSWLRIFHDRVAEQRLEPFPVDDANDMIADVLGKLGNHSRNQVNVELYRHLVNGMLEDISGLQVPVALLHDDFQYSNILVEVGGRTCVLDYALNHRSCVYSDIATLMIDPPTRGLQVWSGGLLIPPNFIRAFNKTILDTYFQGKPYYKSVLDFYCVLAILNKWSADEADLIASKKLYAKFPGRMRSYYLKVLKNYLLFTDPSVV